MKKYFQHALAYTGILIACCFSVAAKAQDFIDDDFLENIETNAKFIWSEASAPFAVTQTPAKWNDESAVVVGYKRSILFDKKTSGGFFLPPARKMYFSLRRCGLKYNCTIKIQYRNFLKFISGTAQKKMAS